MAAKISVWDYSLYSTICYALKEVIKMRETKVSVVRKIVKKINQIY
jgi:hypothetical protein